MRLGVRHIVIAGFLALASGDALAQGAPAGPPGAMPPPSVIVAPVVSKDVADISNYVGRVAAIDKVNIVARVAGFIEERTFTEGQLVKTGDLLFRIEQDTYKAAVEQQQANLAKARAVEINAALQLQRGKALLPKQFVPQSQVDQQTATQRSAAADILEAQAALDQANINLGYTEIRSPINGRIGLVNYTVGNLVGPSTGSLATIVSFDPIYVLFQASSRDVLDFKRRLLEAGPGAGRVTVRARLPDGKLYPEPGNANFLDIQADPSTDTIAVRAIFPNKQAFLVPGAVVQVEIQRGEPRPALLVPQSAVQLDQAGSFVLVVDPANKVEIRRITQGAQQGTAVIAATGLKDGERVIVEGIQKVHPGQVVAASVAPGN